GNVTTCSFKVTVLDDEAPSLVISEPSVWLTQNGPVSYTITYYGATAISLSKSDILLNQTGTATAGAITVTGSGDQRTVTLSDITGDGTVGISIAAGTATDNVDNAAPAAGPSEVFEVDNTAPGLSLAAATVRTLEDVPTAPIAFTITDLVTPVAELQLAGSGDNTTLIPAANYSLSGTGQNRTLVITPALHRHGNANITISVTDKAGQTTSKQFALTVEAVADKPVVSTTDAAGPEDTWIPLSFAAELVDQDGSENLLYYLVENVAAGAALSAGTVQSEGLWKLSPEQLAQLSILPPLNFVGEFTLRIRAASQEASNSSQAESSSVNLIVRVDGVNDAPDFSLSAIEIIKEEDFPDDVVISVLGLQDPDNEASDISFTLSPASVDWVDISIDPATGEITLKSVPDMNQADPFTFTVQANDGSAENNLTARTFSVQILQVNDAPAISIETPWVHAEDFTGAPSRSVAVATPPADETNETITYKISPEPASLNFINLAFNDGTFTATSKENAWGEKELRIRAFDGADSSNVLYFKVRVTPENDAPVFEVVDQDIVLQEDFGTHTQNVITLAAHNDWEPSETYTYSLSPLEHEKITASVDENTGIITFTSVENANASDGIAFTLTATDDGGLATDKTFSLVIERVNDRPYGDLVEVAFAVEETGAHTISPEFYKDVDLSDIPATESLRVTLENAPDWLEVKEGVTTNARWIIELTGTPPKEDDGKVYEDVKAIVTDLGGLVHEDLFRIVVTCNNALPTVAEGVVDIEIFMNSIPDQLLPNYI
ncbi:MAG: cadherin repeat domain-containing protein, partial [Bacteroidetes bacterium]|nr:cadherin repeat domain-containing protein [Bacteroidota bacterium]